MSYCNKWSKTKTLPFWHKNDIPAAPTPLELVQEAGESGACKNTPFLRKSQPHSVLCEEVEDEEDFIAIQGVCWWEKDQTLYLLEEIPDSPLMDFHHFHKTNEEALPAFDSNDIDAESKDDDANALVVVELMYQSF